MKFSYSDLIVKTFWDLLGDHRPLYDCWSSFSEALAGSSCDLTKFKIPYSYDHQMSFLGQCDTCCKIFTINFDKLCAIKKGTYISRAGNHQNIDDTVIPILTYNSYRNSSTCFYITVPDLKDIVAESI